MRCIHAFATGVSDDGRMRGIIRLLPPAALVSLSGAAIACTAPQARPLGPIAADAIAIGRVQGVTGDPSGWEGSALVTRSVVGHVSDRVVRFGKFNICNDMIAPPQPGALWAFYFRWVDGTQTLLRSYPLTWVRGDDPRLQIVDDPTAIRLVAPSNRPE